MTHRTLLPLALPALCMALLTVPLASAQHEPPPAEPATALDWLRRADALTNIRMFGSPPFHMKVTFHAYPGIDFAPRGKSPILTGDGTYEEQWINPKEWRCEVTLGSYHAVEVRAGGVRKFQATSDYEPSRVLMLMNALLAPIPRFFLEDKLQENKIRWKVKHLTAGSLPFVRVQSSHLEGMRSSSEVTRAYDFLPSGLLVRSEEDETALMTSWSRGAPFAGKLVPRHISVQGEGLGQEMLTADVTINPPDPGDTTVLQIAGDAADPGMTLAPVEESDARVNGPTHFEAPRLDPTSSPYPQDVQIIVTYVLARDGTAREAELSGVRVLGQPLTPAQSQVVTSTAMQMVKAAKKDHLAMTIDDAPCELRGRLIMLPLVVEHL